MLTLKIFSVIIPSYIIIIICRKGGEDMSGTQNGVSQVLGSSASVAGGVAVLPMTGGSFLYMILPLTAITCGLVILFTLSLTHVLEAKK